VIKYLYSSRYRCASMVYGWSEGECIFVEAREGATELVGKNRSKRARSKVCSLRQSMLQHAVVQWPKRLRLSAAQEVITALVELRAGRDHKAR
jgi:hypothetical protein